MSKKTREKYAYEYYSSFRYCNSVNVGSDCHLPQQKMTWCKEYHEIGPGFMKLQYFDCKLTFLSSINIISTLFIRTKSLFGTCQYYFFYNVTWPVKKAESGTAQKGKTMWFLYRMSAMYAFEHYCNSKHCTDTAESKCWLLVHNRGHENASLCFVDKGCHQLCLIFCTYPGQSLVIFIYCMTFIIFIMWPQDKFYTITHTYTHTWVFPYSFTVLYFI